MTEIAPTYNSTFAIGGVLSPLDIPIAIGIVVAESFMFRIKLNGKNPAHRQSENRYRQPNNSGVQLKTNTGKHII